MPDLRRQISDPRDLGEAASSRGGGGGAGKGEAWMRIRRRLRAELGEEAFSTALLARLADFMLRSKARR